MKTITYQRNGATVTIPVGFSWLTLFFGIFPSLWRSHWRLFWSIFVVEAIAAAVMEFQDRSDLYQCFIYLLIHFPFALYRNSELHNDLRKDGWKTEVDMVKVADGQFVELPPDFTAGSSLYPSVIIMMIFLTIIEFSIDNVFFSKEAYNKQRAIDAIKTEMDAAEVRVKEQKAAKERGDMLLSAWKARQRGESIPKAVDDELDSIMSKLCQHNKMTYDKATDSCVIVEEI